MSKLFNTRFSYILLAACLSWSVAYSSINPKHIVLDDSSKQSASLPDFSAFTNVSEKKTNFFDFLFPIIQSENQKILRLRADVLSLQEQSSHGELSLSQRQRLGALSKQYNIDTQDSDNALFASLLAKINTIPPSIVLAQAAIESAWGTSRFAKQGNNLFGQWCFKAGCGIVPLNRSHGKTHEVAIFKSIDATVEAYLHNLNSFSAYEHLRELRVTSQRSSDKFNSLHIVEGLKPYSEQADVYVEKIVRMIKSNKLNKYDVRSANI